MIKLLLIVLGLVVGVSLAGYWYGMMNKEQVIVPTRQTEVVATPTPTLNSDQTCTNPTKKFTVSYPANWFTNKTGEPCHFFGTASTVDDRSALVVLDLSFTPADFANQKARLERSDEERIVLSSKAVEASSLVGQKIETEATGIGENAKGARSVYYLIADTGAPVIFSYVEKSSQPNREEYVKILESMVSSFKYN